MLGPLHPTKCDNANPPVGKRKALFKTAILEKHTYMTYILVLGNPFFLTQDIGFIEKTLLKKRKK